MIKKLWDTLIYPLRKLAGWIVWNGPPLPTGWGPWLMGFSIGCKGVRIDGMSKDEVDEIIRRDRLIYEARVSEDERHKTP